MVVAIALIVCSVLKIIHIKDKTASQLMPPIQQAITYAAAFVVIVAADKL